MSRPLELLWSREDEAAVWKPAGLSSERPGEDLDSAIVRARALLEWPDAQLPHRLDRPTEGILLIARDRGAVARHASEQQSRRWSKWYLARIPSRGAGGVQAAGLVGTQRAYLRRQGRRAEVVRSGGDPAFHEVVRVEPVAGAPGESHALLRLGTGRFHQIRAMMAASGFPLVGDADYGGVRGAMELIAAGHRIERDGGAIETIAREPHLRGVSSSLREALAAAVSKGAAA